MDEVTLTKLKLENNIRRCSLQDISEVENSHADDSQKSAAGKQKI